MICLCTAVSNKKNGHIFGRTLDLEYSYAEEAVITPRNYSFRLRNADIMSSHYAMVGIAVVSDGYPLYYDAANEFGLCMAGLNFPGNAHYIPLTEVSSGISVTPFELIPWVLGQCRDINEARILLENLNIVDIPFSSKYPLTPLHWILADKTDTAVIEQTIDGLKLYNAPSGVMTNNPPYNIQSFGLQEYRGLSAKEKAVSFGDNSDNFVSYSRGTGSLGLPGDYTSPSRFIRASFINANIKMSVDETERIGSFFRMMENVSIPRGCVLTDDEAEVVTQYISCHSDESGIYCYTTEGCRRIKAIRMSDYDLDSSVLYRIPIKEKEDIRLVNAIPNNNNGVTI